MLKATLSVKENMDIGTFKRVLAFLKRKSVGYEPKKSKVLSRDEVNTFLREADDEKYLMIKVGKFCVVYFRIYNVFSIFIRLLLLLEFAGHVEETNYILCEFLTLWSTPTL